MSQKAADWEQKATLATAQLSKEKKKSDILIKQNNELNAQVDELIDQNRALEIKADDEVAKLKADAELISGKMALFRESVYKALEDSFDLQKENDALRKRMEK